ncbi:MAG TPA: hypothetical protein PKH43_13690, partial [Saprospiraceae bacterium]|nr:hypothetical protein [Saprospiraceae bacterium]
VAQVPEPEPLPPPGTPAHALLSKLPADLHPVVRAVYLDGLTTLKIVPVSAALFSLNFTKRKTSGPSDQDAEGFYRRI